MESQYTSKLEAPAAGIILDTDMGNDVDDVLALAMLHSLQSKGECNLLGVSVNKASIVGAEFTDIVNTFYSRGDIPIALVGPEGKTPNLDKFAGPVIAASRNGHAPYRLSHDRSNYHPPVTMMRRLLAEKKGPLKIVSIGFLTNLAQLLLSQPDEISPLTGRELIEKHVDLLAIMGGDFSDDALANPCPTRRNWNIYHDIPAAQSVIHNWPGEMVFCGYELGLAITYPAKSILNDFGWAENHPLVDAYKLFATMPYDRPCWDPITALYAVRPDADYFTLSERGHVTVHDEGHCSFQPTANGKSRYLKASPEQQKQIRSTLISLCSQPVNSVSV